MVDNLKTYDERRDEAIRKFIEKLRAKLNSADGEEIVLDFEGNKHRKYVVLKENLRKIIEYIDHLQLESLSPRSLRLYLHILILLADHIKKPFNEVSRDDLEKFLLTFKDKSDSYKTISKLVVKCFYRWFYRSEEYPEIVKWIKVSRKEKCERLPEILTMEEITRMIDVCDNPRDKALIAFLYESGCRAAELLNMKIRDLVFDDYGCVAVVRGKTGERRLRLVSCVAALKEWLNVHPHRTNPEHALFVSLNPPHRPLDGNTLLYLVRKIAKQAGITKKVYPHLFRHTRATHLAKHLREMQLRIYFGWEKNSDMPARYIHLAGADVEDAILEINGIKRKSDEKMERLPTIKCPRCGEENLATNKFCFKCGMILDAVSLQKIDTVKQIVNEVLLHILREMEKGKVGEEDMKKLIRNWVKEGSVI